MIKFLGLIPRRKDISLQQFHDHWRHPHGSMALGMTMMRRYVQAHRVDCPLLPLDQSRFDGIAELWFDNRTEALGLMEDPVYVQHVGPDEVNFVDLPALKFTFVEEEVLLARPHLRHGASYGDACWTPDNRPLSMKLAQLIETDGTKPWAQPDDAQLSARIGATRHVRSRPVAEIHNGNIDRVGPAPFVGVRELWWPTLHAFNQGVAQAPEAFKELLSRPARSYAALFQAERML